MKTVISISDDLFRRAESLAKRTKKSRSQLYSEALREYLNRHSEDDITTAINRVIDEVGDEPDPFIAAAARRLLERVEW
jgi:metal-responsive CopG/Arc/MetJ family transcriptional regulator